MSSHRSARSPLRTVSGVLAGGLVVLTVALGVAWFVATRTGSPGPAPGFLAWHAVAATVALGAQLRADRDPDRAGSVAAGVVVLISVAVPAVLWLS